MSKIVPPQHRLYVIPTWRCQVKPPGKGQPTVEKTTEPWVLVLLFCNTNTGLQSHPVPLFKFTAGCVLLTFTMLHIEHHSTSYLRVMPIWPIERKHCIMPLQCHTKVIKVKRHIFLWSTPKACFSK
jgi:hypothetical protein